MEVTPVASTSRLPEDSATADSRRETSELSIDEQAGSTETPVVRGRGRGRPRGSKARGRGRPRGKGLPKLNWQRPRPGDSSDDEVQFLAQHTVHPDKGNRASEPLAGGSDGAAPNSDALPDVAAVSGKRSRSGRQIVKPVKIVPSTEPSFYRVGLRRTRSGRQAAENGDSSICSICLLGHSPQANLLVTCDICETSYHQLCHTPAISDDIATNSESTWFCAQCEPKKTITAVPPMWEERVVGQGLPERDKLEYLRKLPHESLVKLLLDIESHISSVRIYPANLASILSDYRQAMAVESEQIDARQSILDSLLDEEARKLDDNGSKRLAEAGSTDRNKRSRANPPNQDLASGLAHLPDMSASANPYSDPARQASAEEPQQGNTTHSEDLLDPELRTLASNDTPSTQVVTSAVPASTAMPSQVARQATNYEEMAIEALEYINDPHGSPPRMIYQWMYDTYPVSETFRPSAGQALNRAAKRGRLLKEGILYKINPDFDDSLLTDFQKQPTRTLKLASRSTRKPTGTRPREEYLTPSHLYATAASADDTNTANQNASVVAGTMDQFDMLDDEDDYVNADQLEEESEEDEQNVVDVPDFNIQHESESQDADMDSFLAEFMSADPSVPAPGHEMDHLLDPSLFAPDNYQSAFYLGINHTQ